MASIPARDRLIVALDFATTEDARALIRQLGDEATFYKVGLELAMHGGLELARALASEGKNVFLDLKLLDIANTVERATRSAAAIGATFLTVHGQDLKTLRAAAAGRAGTKLKLLAVTVLTNLTAEDLRQQGIAATPEDLVVRRAQLAQAAGCEGVIASGREVRHVRGLPDAQLLIVTPGIRLSHNLAGDQARAATPLEAIAAGADYLVVGRPISRAEDPRKAFELFVQSIDEAVAMRTLGPQ